jgi:hypothetical protein
LPLYYMERKAIIVDTKKAIGLKLFC